MIELTAENMMKGALVVAALQRPSLPLLDAGPEVGDDWATDILQVLKGARNGAWYGARIRCVHTVVMMILFSKLPLEKKIQKVLDNAWTHARNLGGFAFIFKALLVVLRRYSGMRKSWHSAVAGLCGGSVIWSTDDPIVVQINLYLFSRICFGAAKLGADALEMTPNKEQTARNYKVFGSVVWMVVMWLFYNHPLKLQQSLAASMQEIYRHSDSVGPRSIQP
ncbi:hypothetical protein DIPPA_21366 [Diplonema papillatum]|nr:hypothetical protein DIPPA_21366 [Diplonema papillatum]